MSAPPVIAVDPGNQFSAYAEFYEGELREFGKRRNSELRNLLRCFKKDWHLAIETLHPRGMPTAAEEMEMQLWAGAMIEAFCGFEEEHFTRMKRMDVKMTICGHPRAKDANIRAALIDKWGGKEMAIGKKKNPGSTKSIQALSLG